MTELTLAERSVELVRTWIDPERASAHRADPAAERLAKLLKDPHGLDFTVGFVDRVVRPEDPRVAARNLRRARAAHPDVPAGQSAHPAQARRRHRGPVPRLVVSIARRTLRRMVGHLVVDARPRSSAARSSACAPAATGSTSTCSARRCSARARPPAACDGTLALLERDDVDYVSVKVSSVASQLSMWAFDETVGAGRRAAHAALRAGRRDRRADVHQPRHGGVPRPRPHGRGVHRRCSTAEFPDLEAGIVLQAYLPDCARRAAATSRVGDRAARRRAARRIKVRVVKGANLAWSGSTPRCTAGRWRPRRPSRRPTPTTSACSTGR